MEAAAASSMSSAPSRWACRACTLWNPMRSTACKACRAARADRSSDPVFVSSSDSGSDSEIVDSKVLHYLPVGAHPIMSSSFPLPVDCWTHTATFLSILDHLSLARVCRGLRELMQWPNAWTALNFVRLRWLVDDQFITRFHRYTKVDVIDLKDCTTVHDGTLALLQPFKLKRLDLAGCWRITDEGIQHLSVQTQLEELSVAWCYKIKSLAALRDIPSLRTVDISGCWAVRPGLSDAVVLVDRDDDTLTRQRPSCRRVIRPRAPLRRAVPSRAAAVHRASELTGRSRVRAGLTVEHATAITAPAASSALSLRQAGSDTGGLMNQRTSLSGVDQPQHVAGGAGSFAMESGAAQDSLMAPIGLLASTGASAMDLDTAPTAIQSAGCKRRREIDLTEDTEHDLSEHSGSDDHGVSADGAGRVIQPYEYTDDSLDDYEPDAGDSVEESDDSDATSSDDQDDD